MVVSSRTTGLLAPGLVLGFAFSGLFDGILLHQVLQWHHLLSLVEGEPLRDLRVQVMADGAFHMLMYFVAAAGLWLLWRRRNLLSTPRAGTRSAAAFILGFGGWNVVDVVVFHWVLEIHHIRLTAGQQIASDVIWLVVLGFLPLILGWLLWRRADGDGGSGLKRRFKGSLPQGLAGLVVVAAIISLAPPASPQTAVLFRPGYGGANAVNAVAAIGGRMVSIDPTGELVVVELDDPFSRWRLYRYGALMIGGAGPAGCLSYLRA